MEKLNIKSTAYPVEQLSQQEWMQEFSVGCRIPKKTEYVFPISLEKYIETIKSKFLTVESVNS